VHFEEVEGHRTLPIQRKVTTCYLLCPLKGYLTIQLQLIAAPPLTAVEKKRIRLSWVTGRVTLPPDSRASSPSSAARARSAACR